MIMSKRAPVVANTTIQLYALLFLLLGGGAGAALGYQVGAADIGGYTDITAVPPMGEPKVFNWLLFEIGLCTGLIACAVLLAASFRNPVEPMADN